MADGRCEIGNGRWGKDSREQGAGSLKNRETRWKMKDRERLKAEDRVKKLKGNQALNCELCCPASDRTGDKRDVVAKLTKKFFGSSGFLAS